MTTLNVIDLARQGRHGRRCIQVLLEFLRTKNSEVEKWQDAIFLPGERASPIFAIFDNK
jgi:hypothetical protein